MTIAERRAAAAARLLTVAPDLSVRLSDARVVVFDCETTGTDPAEARIVELAAVVYDALGTSDPRVIFWTKVNPGVPILSGATDVHGIRDEDVADAPTFAQVWPVLLRTLGEQPFVPCAYNVPYDQAVLRNEALRAGAGVHLPAWMDLLSWLDPLVLARAIDQFERGKKLRDVAGRRGITHAEHGAAADATVAGMLLVKLLTEAAAGVKDRRGETRVKLARGLTVGDALKWQLALAIRDERDTAEYRAKSGSKTPPDWTWHRLSGTDVPPLSTPPAPTTATCSTCGEPIIWLVNEKGSRCPVNPAEFSVVTFATMKARDVEPEWFAGYKRRAGYVETVDAAGVEMPDDERPELPRSLLRESHFATCAQAAQHRKVAGA